jgi:hypothetical protein
VAHIDPKLASAIDEEAHDHLSDQQIARLPLYEVVRRFGGAAAAQVDLKRTWDTRGDNSPPSKGPGGVIDKQFPISGYESYSQCVEGLVNDLSLDRTNAENECATHFGGAETSSDAGKKTAAANRKKAGEIIRNETKSHYARVCEKGKSCSAETRQKHIYKLVNAGYALAAATREVDSILSGTTGGNHLLQTTKQNSRTLQVHNASVNNSETIPSWIVVSGGDTSHIVNTSSSRIRSAKEEQQNAMYNYMMARQINHPDSTNATPYNEEMEKMIREHAEYRNDIAEILYQRKIKSGAIKKPDPYEGKPALAICAGY